MYRRLRATTGPLQGCTFPLCGRLVLGRAGDIEVQLIGSAVSRHHAEVVDTEDGRVILNDLKSKNGTFVDGRPVESLELQDGDAFEIGSSVFVFELAHGQPIDEDTSRLSLVSGPAEAETSVFDSPAFERPATDRPTTAVPHASPASEAPEPPSRRCADPLHSTAENNGWRFCPACGESTEGS